MFWVNVVRIVVAIACLISLVIMISNYVTERKVWNEKTKDLWYGRMMWTLVGLSAGIEGTLRNVPFRYTLVLIVAATLSTLKGVLKKGHWGNGNDSNLPRDESPRNLS